MVHSRAPFHQSPQWVWLSMHNHGGKVKVARQYFWEGERRLLKREGRLQAAWLYCKQCRSVIADLGRYRTYRCLACSIWSEAAQQAAEEVHEADWQVDVSCGDDLSAVAPHKSDAGVHQPLEYRKYLQDSKQKACLAF